MVHQTCIVCYDTSDKYITCIKCKNISCKQCQIIWSKPFCMNCNNEFSRKELLNIFNLNEINNYIGDFWKKTYFEREKKNIEKTIEYINIIKEYDKYKEKIRLGLKTKFVNIDIDSYINDSESKTPIKRCIKTECNGIIYNNKCISCDTIYCNKCFEIVLDKKHICDKNTLTSIQSMKSECKECPSCACLIFKISGCNDMRCTHCGTYFTWDKLIISSKYKNSNPTTDNELINNNVTILNELEFTEYKIIKYIYENKYEKNIIYNNYRKKLLKERVKYVKGNITDLKYMNIIYNIEQEYNKLINNSFIIEKYIKYVTSIKNKNNIYNNIINYLEELNSDFKEVQRHYGGKLLQFNTKFDNTPPLTEN